MKGLTGLGKPVELAIAEQFGRFKQAVPFHTKPDRQVHAEMPLFAPLALARPVQLIQHAPFNQ
jgi:hypothetical protein